ncbi:MAG: class I SAM-dependent methyltransferase [Aureliella sp.]
MAESLAENATIVEIGVWQGRSAVFMAEKLKELGKSVRFHLVDSFDGGNILAGEARCLDRPLIQILKDNLRIAKVAGQVTGILEMSSVAAALKFSEDSVDFAFIDADHTYESVIADIRAWWPKIKVGGTLSGHDYVSGWVGVAKAVDEIVAQHSLSFFHGMDAWQIRKRSCDPRHIC